MNTIETWLEVTITDNHVFFSDWTHTMMLHWKLGHEREFRNLQKHFMTVAGKTHTYHIWSYGLNYEQCKAIAIKYHIARESGNIGKYRLD